MFKHDMLCMGISSPLEGRILLYAITPWKGCDVERTVEYGVGMGRRNTDLDL